MIWLDAHLSPRIATWIRAELELEATALRDLGLRDAEDTEIFDQGRTANVIILTKDKDFAEMVMRRSSPPSVIWLRSGNTSEERLKELLSKHLFKAIEYIKNGESIVEIR